MPRLIITWCVLLLIAASEIQLVHSDLEVGYNIEIGNLTSEDALVISAVAKLSSGENQQGWWKFAKAGWHDSAIQRFFAKGPLLPADMKKLAEESGKSVQTWNASNIVNVNRNTDLMLALQSISTATYAVNKTIEGTGRIEASMWTVLFRCIGIGSCDEGYFVPMIFVQGSTENQQQPDDHNYQDTLNIRSLWRHLTTNLLVNAIPSSIARLQPPAMAVTMPNQDNPDLSITVNVYRNVAECPPVAVLDYRSLLDASYGLVPGLSCISFSTSDQPLKLVVSRLVFFDNATEPRDNPLTTLDSFFSVIQVKTHQWNPLPFEDCSAEGLLIPRSSQDPKSLMLCYQTTCVTSYIGNATCSTDGVQYLRFLHSIITQSKSCTCNGGKPLHPSNNTAGTEVSCQMRTANKVWAATVEFVDMNSTYNVNPLRLLSPASNWTSTEGIDTSEFRGAPHMTDFNGNTMCIRTVSPLSPLFFSNTTQADFLQAIQIHASVYLNSFIAEHNIAFTTTKGPATDSRSFLALIVSTAISVILAIAGPFPNFLLRIICRRWPLLLDSQRRRASKLVNVLFAMICNVLLSFCSFLPVLYMAWSELDRETRFHTWDLGSNDRPFIYRSEMLMRVVYVISATSTYHSNFIIGSTVAVCITCILAGGCSAWRSKEVFDRYALLQKYDIDPLKALAAADRQQTLLVSRALKAIDMTDAEYLDMKTEVMNHVRTQKLARFARKTARTGNTLKRDARILRMRKWRRL